MTSAGHLAAVIVDLADVRVVLATLDVEGEDVSDDAVTAVHRILNPNSEPTMPELYYPEA